MDIIKKKISLEPFKARIPINVNTINGEESWGGIARPITFSILDDKEDIVDGPMAISDETGINHQIKDMERITINDKLFHTIKYETAISLYYELLNIVINLTYKEYVKKTNRWIDAQYDWREILLADYHINLVTEIPKNIPQIPIVAIVSEDIYDSFYNKPKTILKDNTIDGFDYINLMHEKIGRTVVPVSITGSRVPYMIWNSEIDILIEKLSDLKGNVENTCCNKVMYDEYGGDSFLNFLKQCDKTPVSNNKMTYIDIPILITANIKDLGNYNVYDDTNVFSDVAPSSTEKEITKTFISGIQGESKLMTLRKRKRSIDDLGQELPGIYKQNTTKLESPYQIGYIKNIQIVNGKYYGDTIVSMEENEDGTEITITYVIGGRLKVYGSALTIDEISPYLLQEGDNWDGEGIWYQETYPFYKELTWNGKLDNSEKLLTYDYIDFNDVSITYTFNGIDFPRENYILCKDIRYQANSYKEGATSLPVFRIDNGLNNCENVKESYDVLIDRGSAAAFERHLVLSEIKTFQDLELLRNNMFNI